MQSMPEIEPDVRAYYERGNEVDRLKGGFPSGPLEFVRTQEILLRYLPPPPLEVLDVGGGPGVYAAWLTERGDKVLVIDPIPLHVDQARSAHARVNAEIGDARHLVQKDSSYDIVLLMGSLYHLVERDERLLALREAKRVLLPGGLLFASAISRFAALMDLLVRLDRVHEPEILPMVEQSVATAIFHGAVGGLFTTAYFHRPRDFVREVGESRLCRRQAPECGRARVSCCRFRNALARPSPTRSDAAGRTAGGGRTRDDGSVQPSPCSWGRAKLGRKTWKEPSRHLRSPTTDFTQARISTVRILSAFATAIWRSSPDTRREHFNSTSAATWRISRVRPSVLVA